MKNILITTFCIALIVASIGCAKAVLQSDLHNVNHNVAKAGSVGYFLPKGLIKVGLKQVKQNNVAYYKISIDRKFVPDPNYFFTLKYVPSSWADDTVTVQWEGYKEEAQKDDDQKDEGPTGLLKFVEANPKDKIYDIIVNKLLLPLNPQKFADLTVPKGKVKGAELKVEPFIEAEIDPEVKDDIERLTAQLKGLGIDFTVKPLVELIEDGQRGFNAEDYHGICYRPCLPYLVTISSNKDYDGDFSKMEIINLPNGAPILSLDVTRARFVTKKTTITLDKGFLQTVAIDKESEALGLVTILPEVAKSIIALPSNLIKLKILYSGYRTGYYQQHLKEMEKLDELIDTLNKPGF